MKSKIDYSIFQVVRIASVAGFFLFVSGTASAAQQTPNDITVTVTPMHFIRLLDADDFGINTAAWDAELGTPDLNSLIEKTGIKSFRYPGGSWSDSFDWTKPRWPGMPMTKDFVKTVEAAQGDGIITLNYGEGTPQMAAAWVAYCDSSPKSKIVIAGDDKGIDWKTAGYWASLRAAIPLAKDDGLNDLRASHLAPFPVHLFELGNECYGSWEDDNHTPKHDPATYGQFYIDAFKIIKRVSPSARLGAVVTDDEDGGGDGQEVVINPITKIRRSGWTPVMLNTLRSRNITPDFVIYHYYPEQPGHEDDSYLLQSTRDWASATATMKEMLADYLHTGSKQPDLYCTENNSVTFNPGKQSTSLVDAIYLADSFGTVLTDGYTGYYWWALHSGVSTNFNNSSSLYGWRKIGDYGVLASGKNDPSTATDTPFPTFKAFELLSHFCRAGDDLVEAQTSSNMLTAYAVRQRNGIVNVLLINKSPVQITRVHLSVSGNLHGGGPAVVRTYGIQQDDDQARGRPSDSAKQTLTGAGGQFDLLITPYSINVVSLS
jgi:alpha-N-arabinofuranosidase